MNLDSAFVRKMNVGNVTVVLLVAFQSPGKWNHDVCTQYLITISSLCLGWQSLKIKCDINKNSKTQGNKLVPYDTVSLKLL